MKMIFVISSCLMAFSGPALAWQEDQNPTWFFGRTAKMQVAVSVDKQIGDSYINSKQCLVEGKLVDRMSEQCMNSNERCELQFYSEDPVEVPVGTTMINDETYGVRGSDFPMGSYSWIYMRFQQNAPLKVSLKCERVESSRTITQEEILNLTSGALEW